MPNKSLSILVILGLTAAMVLSFATVAQKNISMTENSLTKNSLTWNNTSLNKISLSNIDANNTSISALSKGSEINGYPRSSPTNVPSVLNASQMDNGTKMAQTVNETIHQRHSINLGSLAKNEINKPGRDLERVFFICNIV